MFSNLHQYTSILIEHQCLQLNISLDIVNGVQMVANKISNLHKIESIGMIFNVLQIIDNTFAE